MGIRRRGEKRVQVWEVLPTLVRTGSGRMGCAEGCWSFQRHGVTGERSNHRLLGVLASVQYDAEVAQGAGAAAALGGAGC